MALKRMTSRVLLEYTPSAILVPASPGQVYRSEPRDVPQHPEFKLFTHAYSLIRN